MDAGFTNDSHEVGVAVPAGHNVEMDVTGYACTSDGADVETDIEAIAMIGIANIFFSQPGVAHQLDPVGFGKVFDACGMARWRDHEMAVGVREQVEQTKTSIAAKDDEIGLFLAWLRLLAKDAGRTGRVCLGYVAISPGTPEVIQDES